MVVGRLLSFWEGPFSGAMLVSGRVGPLDGVVAIFFKELNAKTRLMVKQIYPRVSMKCLHLDF